MSRTSMGLILMGLIALLGGAAAALAYGDKFLGLALVLIGAFLIFLPITRPSLDE